MEGAHPYDGGTNPEGGGAAGVRVRPRATAAARSPAASSTGATAIPALAGAYLFTDYCDGRCRAIRGPTAARRPSGRTFDAEGVEPGVVRHDAAGEVYVLSLDGGIYRLDAADELRTAR